MTFLGHSVAALAMLVSTSLVMSARAGAQENVRPVEFDGVGVEERMNQVVPGELTFQDQSGKMVRLADVIPNDRPTVINLAYFRCPMLCGMVQQGAVKSLKQQAWSIGKEFNVVTVSIDPRDDMTSASQKRNKLLSLYNRPSAEAGWTFLTGTQSMIDALANAIGFHVKYDEASGDYAHPAALVFLGPGRKITRYLYGLEFEKLDMRLALLESSQGLAKASPNMADRMMMFCFQYDPKGQKYGLAGRFWMRVGGVITMFALGGTLFALWRREFKKSAAAEKAARQAQLESGTGLIRSEIGTS